MTVIYSSDLFTYNVKYFQTLSAEKCRSFANYLLSMLNFAPQCITLLGNLKHLKCLRINAAFVQNKCIFLTTLLQQKLALCYEIFVIFGQVRV